jgi:glycosyltransferase family protein
MSRASLSGLKRVCGYYGLKSLAKLHWYRLRARRHVARMPLIYDESRTLNIIIKRKCSVARYGDGEIGICLGDSAAFQTHDKDLAARLRQILIDEPPANLLVCIAPHTQSCYTMTPRVRMWAYKFIARRGASFTGLLNPARFYGSTFISRPDAFELSPPELAHLRDLWRQVWDRRDILVVTGPGSRFLLEPDLFDNVRSSEFLYGPSEDAFRQYDDILSRVRGYSRDKLILIALGPTATVLAYDLAKEGHQAIDLGHLPSCYNLVKSGSRPAKTGY